MCLRSFKSPFEFAPGSCSSDPKSSSLVMEAHMGFIVVVLGHLGSAVHVLGHLGFDGGCVGSFWFSSGCVVLFGV